MNLVGEKACDGKQHRHHFTYFLLWLLYVAGWSLEEFAKCIAPRGDRFLIEEILPQQEGVLFSGYHAHLP